MKQIQCVYVDPVCGCWHSVAVGCKPTFQSQ